MDIQKLMWKRQRKSEVLGGKKSDRNDHDHDHDHKCKVGNEEMYIA